MTETSVSHAQSISSLPAFPSRVKQALPLTPPPSNPVSNEAVPSTNDRRLRNERLAAHQPAQLVEFLERIVVDPSHTDAEDFVSALEAVAAVVQCTDYAQTNKNWDALVRARIIYPICNVASHQSIADSPSLFLSNIKHLAFRILHGALSRLKKPFNDLDKIVWNVIKMDCGMILQRAPPDSIPRCDPESPGSIELLMLMLDIEPAYIRIISQAAGKQNVVGDILKRWHRGETMHDISTAATALFHLEHLDRVDNKRLRAEKPSSVTMTKPFFSNIHRQILSHGARALEGSSAEPGDIHTKLVATFARHLGIPNLDDNTAKSELVFLVNIIRSLQAIGKREFIRAVHCSPDLWTSLFAFLKQSTRTILDEDQDHAMSSGWARALAFLTFVAGVVEGPDVSGDIEPLVILWIKCGLIDALEHAVICAQSSSENRRALVASHISSIFSCLRIPHATYERRQVIAQELRRPRMFCCLLESDAANTNPDYQISQDSHDALYDRVHMTPSFGSFPIPRVCDTVYTHHAWRNFVGLQMMCADVKMCGRTGCDAIGTQSCPVCGLVQYCSAECQAIDVADHQLLHQFADGIKGARANDTRDPPPSFPVGYWTTAFASAYPMKDLYLELL